MNEVGFIYHPDYLLHDTGQHPERPARLEAIRDAVRLADYPFVRWVTPISATEQQVARVLWPSYLDYLRRLAASGGGSPEQDTIVSPDSYRVALLAAGGAIAAADMVVRGEVQSAFAAVRPPGHHSGPGSAAGFCLVNNVAVAAAHARSALGIDRVLIVDFDGHHGNGTQAIFEQDAGCLLVSIHEYPFYPGTGSLSEVGRGAGRGYTVNVPIPAGAGDDAYVAIFGELVEPIARAYKPGLILVSAGYDAHWRDPLVLLEVTTRGFAWMASELVRWAGEICAGRLAFVLEGGYDLEALGESVVATLAILGGSGAPELDGAPDWAHSTDVRPTIAEVKKAHPWWFSRSAR
jgi:acetoin utilization deacetylase AcuC-like enzyme